ncbi:BQ2448_3796 [Microbotryum intermedium]|uniref:BQ2448_3796 protein n=1 Tax=Microbotryum intermedium TaxID=269621 RepID=A0A238FGM0_9BASI|nr:BQ2448_3796 [Microbotryum intermedium]
MAHTSGYKNSPCTAFHKHPHTECPNQVEEIIKFGCDTCKDSLDHCKAPAAQPVSPSMTQPTPTEPETDDTHGQGAAVLVNPPAAKPAEGLPLVKHLTKAKCRPKPMTKPAKPCPCHRKKGAKHAVIIPECAETIKFIKNHHHHHQYGRKYRHHRPKPCNGTC